MSKHAMIVRSNCHKRLLARQPLANVWVATQYERVDGQVCHCRQQLHVAATAFGIIDKELRDRAVGTKTGAVRYTAVDNDEIAEGMEIMKARNEGTILRLIGRIVDARPT